MSLKRKPKSPNSGLVLVQEYTVTKEIAELQLNRLRDIARERLLSYEESKIFDILAKNLSLANGEPTAILNDPNQPKQLESNEEQDLLKIAQLIKSENIDSGLNIIEDAKDGSNKDSIK